MYHEDQMGAGGWVFMVLLGVVVLGLVAAFVVWLMQDQRRRPPDARYAPAGSAAEILDRRLATGEIAIEEYERVKASLAAPPTSGPPATPAAPT